MPKASERLTQTHGIVSPLPSCYKPSFALAPPPLYPKQLLRPSLLTCFVVMSSCMPWDPLSDSDHNFWGLIPACPIFRPVTPRPLLSIPARSRSSLGSCLLKGSAEREKGEAPGQTQWQTHRPPGRGFTMGNILIPNPYLARKAQEKAGQGQGSEQRRGACWASWRRWILSWALETEGSAWDWETVG